MAFEHSILSQGLAELDFRKMRHIQKIAERKASAYEKDPVLFEIDRDLRLNMTRLVGVALCQEVGLTVEAVQKTNSELQEKRKAHILALHLVPEDLDSSPLCVLCNDSGWDGRHMCGCLEEICLRLQQESFGQVGQFTGQSFHDFSLDFYSSEIWAGHSMSPRETMSLTLQVCQAYAKQFKHFPVSNLLLSGAPGLGKSFLSSCIAKTVQDSGHTVVYVGANLLFSHFNTKQFRSDSAYENEIALTAIERYLHCDLLILDDLGSEFTVPLVTSSLFDLVDSRMNAELNTIISTNLSVAEISKRYAPQIGSRLGGVYQVLHFVGDDIRQLKPRH